MRDEPPRFEPEDGASCRAMAIAILWSIALVALCGLLAAIGWGPAT